MNKRFQHPFLESSSNNLFTRSDSIYSSLICFLSSRFSVFSSASANLSSSLCFSSSATYLSGVALGVFFVEVGVGSRG